MKEKSINDNTSIFSIILIFYNHKLTILIKQKSENTPILKKR